MKMKFNWIDVLIIVLFIVVLYLLLSRIFGHSPTDLTVSVSLFTFLGAVVFRMQYILLNLSREVGGIKINMINSFKKVSKGDA
jgi:TRAP-type mannitol/chloroaromatic compound transport system permease large subunit